jgi:hypothetical protein
MDDTPIARSADKINVGGRVYRLACGQHLVSGSMLAGLRQIPGCGGCGENGGETVDKGRKPWIRLLITTGV